MSSYSLISRAVRYALLTGAAVAGAATVPAHAADETISEVIVTGSRIPRANLTAPTAVTTIDAEVIRQSGLNNVADILRAVPSFGVSALSSSNSNFLTTSAGINTLQLRNLDEARTLVLVNGRRYVSGVPGEASVDFNTIPIALVDRVEIITGGASAIYGSDALAGVINLILKKDFKGVDFGYQFGEADAGGNIENRVTFTAGSDFADGRGNAVVSATFNQNKGLWSRDRANTRIDDLALCRSPGRTKEDCQTENEPVFSSFAEGGRFFVPSTGQSFGIAGGTGATATVAPWSTTDFGFNRQAFRRYTVPTERYLVSTLLDYELTPNVKTFVEGTFAQTRTASEIEPFPHSNSDLNIAGIPIDNPFIPAAIRDAVLAAGDTDVEYFRRTTELGNRGAESTRNTYRFVTGLEGDIQNAYRWETYYAFGRMDDAQQGGGQVNVLNMREALNVVLDPDSGDYVCANDYARAEGCVPINLFGKGSISPEAAAYVRAPTSRQMSTQQEVFGADIGGPLFELPAGPMSFAFGGEWRRERSKDIPDVLTQAGLNAGNAEAPTVGGFDVAEGFVELEVPLLKDLPLVYDLSIGAAYRYSDYSTVGNTNAYAGRVSWSPIEPLRFRAQYARAVRAPNIGELFAPGGENFESVSDPCGGVTATTEGVTAQNCRSVPAIAARIAATGVFALSQTEIQGTGGFTSKGNPLLDVETSDSWSFGLVLDSNLGNAGDMTVSVDYFQISIDDLIDTVDRQTAADFCYNATNFPNQFCPFLTRDTDGPAFQLGELTEVNSGFVNEGTLDTEGIDLSVLWRRDLWAGQAAVRLNYTYLIDFTETKFGAEDNLVGETGYARNRAQTAFVYSIGPWMGSWEWNFISNSVPDKSNELFNFSVGSYNTHDFQLSYDFGQSGMLSKTPFEGTRVYLGINNVFDEDAPIILSGVPGNTTGTDTDADVYDPVGRTWYAGLNVSF
jgi:outer membrane receptor protein involved in Fe transport